MRDLSALRATTTRTPPPDGLDTVVGTARRRIRNRAAGSTAFAAVAALVALAAPSWPDRSGLVGVEPTATAGASVTASPSAAPTAAGSPAPAASTSAASPGPVPPARAPGAGGDATAGPAPSPTPPPSPAPAPAARGEQPAAYAYRPYAGYVPPPNTADPCVGQEDESPHLTGWCAHARIWDGTAQPYAVAAGQRTRVDVQLCRAERATPATLHRSGARWFTLTATGAAGDVAWRWDAGGPPAERAVDVGSGDCLTWQVPWQVRLAAGEYRVQVRFGTDDYRPGPDANRFTVVVRDPA